MTRILVYIGCCSLGLWLNHFTQAQSTYPNPIHLEGGGIYGQYFFNEITPHVTESRIYGFYIQLIRPEYHVHQFGEDFILTGGLRTSFLDFNNQYIGHGISLQPFIRFLIGSGSFKVKPELGFGGIFITRPFDIEANNLNLAIGAPLSFHISTGMVLQQSIGHGNYLMCRIGIDHISNGSIKQPNFGLNIWQASLGYQRFLKSGNSHTKINFRDFKHQFHGYFGIGFREFEINSGLSAILDLGLIYTLKMYRAIGISARLDHVWDYSTRMQVARTTDYHNSFRRWEAGLGGQVAIGRLIPFIEWGFFLRRQPDWPATYYRIGLRGRISETITLSGNVLAFDNTKSSYAVIFGIQYAFYQR